MNQDKNNNRENDMNKGNNTKPLVQASSTLPQLKMDKRLLK
jgi:hypothetical protein